MQNFNERQVDEKAAIKKGAFASTTKLGCADGSMLLVRTVTIPRFKTKCTRRFHTPKKEG